MHILVQLILNPNNNNNIDNANNSTTVTIGYHKNTCVLPKNGNCLYPKCVLYAYQIIAIEYNVFDNIQDTKLRPSSIGNRKYCST